MKTAQAYYRLAHGYTRVFPRPFLLIVCGLMGTGKTTVASELARRWSGVHISSDVTRKALAGIAPTERRYEAYSEGIYTDDMSERTYAFMLAQAREAVEQGRLAVLDATYRSVQERGRVVAAARTMGVDPWVVECVASDAVVCRRVNRRAREGTSPSDARWELHAQQKAEWEPVAEVPAHSRILLDTRGSLSGVMRRLLRILYFRVLKP